jgi:signal transduction histidine kinase
MVEAQPKSLHLSTHSQFRGNESALLEALLGCTDYGVLITRIDTRQDILCNAQFGELFGLDTDQTVNLSPREVREQVLPRLKDRQGFLDDLQKVYANPSYERVDELELIQPDQTLRRHTCPLWSEDGTLLGRVWTFLDITTLKELHRQVERYSQGLEALVEERTRALQDLHEQLVESEKLAAVGLLAATVAHDLRNILTPMEMELSVLPIEDRESKEAFTLQFQRMTALIHRLLSLKAPPRLSVARVPLMEVWERAEPLLRSQAEHYGCRIVTRFPADPILVEVNVDQIEQVFLNLALNAFTAMSPSGGTLTVEMLTNDRAWIHFYDTGPGVSQEIEASLFQPFVSGRSNGTGLGLYSCRRIARDHGGEVTLTNHDHGGAVSTLRLPLAFPDGL